MSEPGTSYAVLGFKDSGCWIEGVDGEKLDPRDVSDARLFEAFLLLAYRLSRSKELREDDRLTAAKALESRFPNAPLPWRELP